MRCQRAQQRLMAYHDGELSPGARRRVEKHIESCNECGQLVKRLRRADHHAGSAADAKGLVGVPDMPPPDDRYWESFTARVLDLVEEDAATRAPDSLKPRRSWNFNIPRMAPAFSIALVVVVAAGVLLKIGDPVPVPNAPIAQVKPDPEKNVPVATEGILPDESDRDGTVYYADTHDDESQPTLAKEAPGNDDALRSVPTSPSADASAVADQAKLEASPSAKATGDKAEDKFDPEPAPEQIASLEGIEEGSPVLRKREAMAAPDVETQYDEGGAAVAMKPEVEEVTSQKVETDQRSLLTSELKVDDGTVIGGVDEEVSGVPLPSILDQAKLSHGIFPEDSISGSKGKAETLNVMEDKPSTVPTIKRADLEALEKKDNKVQGNTAASPEELAASPVTAGTMIDNSVLVTQKSPAAATIESSTPSKQARQAFSSKLPYRGPEDQLIHARNLADVRKFWESEQVLKDLLSQGPSIYIQEKASILLVKVLSSQNRVVEAQQVLDDARGQFPASETIQTFDLKQNGE